MLNHVSKYAFAAFVAGVGPLSQSIAQTRAAVTVRVQLVTPKYHDRFTNRTEVEGKAARLFAEYLTKNIGFLRFVADDSTRPYRLAFRLDKVDPTSTSDFAEVGFWAHLDRPEDTPRDVYWLPFRSADQALVKVGDQEQFLTELESKLAHRETDSLRAGVLRWIPVSEMGFLPDLQPTGVVLPFPLLELCMKKQSTLEFLAEFVGPVTREEPFKALVEGTYTPQGPASPDVEPFRNGGFAKVMDLASPNDLSRSVTSHTVKVKKIFVTGYVHDPTACNNRTPSIGGGVP